MSAFSSLRVYALHWRYAHFHLISIAVLALGLVTLPISLVSHTSYQAIRC